MDLEPFSRMESNGMEQPLFVFQLLKQTWKQFWKNISGQDDKIGQVPL